MEVEVALAYSQCRAEIIVLKVGAETRAGWGLLERKGDC